MAQNVTGSGVDYLCKTYSTFGKKKVCIFTSVNWFSSLRPSDAFSGRFAHCYSLLAFFVYGQVYENKYYLFRIFVQLNLSANSAFAKHGKSKKS